MYDLACKLIYEEVDLSIANKIISLLDKDFDAQAARIAELEAAIESVSFHYWNCLGDCPKFKPEMAKLAALIKYDDGCGNEYLSETTN